MIGYWEWLQSHQGNPYNLNESKVTHTQRVSYCALDNHPFMKFLQGINQVQSESSMKSFSPRTSRTHHTAFLSKGRYSIHPKKALYSSGRWIFRTPILKKWTDHHPWKMLLFVRHGRSSEQHKQPYLKLYIGDICAFYLLIDVTHVKFPSIIYRLPWYSNQSLFSSFE